MKTSLGPPNGSFDAAGFAGFELPEQGRVVEWNVYFKGHSQLLLRAPRHSGPLATAYPTRVDILFKGVQFVKLPTTMRGLSISLADARAAATIENEMGRRPQPGDSIFLVRGTDFSGYVVAAAVFFSEDDDESSYAASPLTQDFEVTFRPPSRRPR